MKCAESQRRRCWEKIKSRVKKEEETRNRGQEARFKEQGRGVRILFDLVSLWQTFYCNVAIVGVFHQQLLKLNMLEI